MERNKAFVVVHYIMCILWVIMFALAIINPDPNANYRLIFIFSSLLLALNYLFEAFSYHRAEKSEKEPKKDE